MVQSRWQIALGYFWLTLDTILQRFINWGAARECRLFHQSSRSLVGKKAVITGANTGLGFETARWLVENGATVVLACRNLGKAEAAAEALRKEIPDADVDVEKLDLADLNSVRSCAERMKGAEIHMLILNAGVMAAKRANIEEPEPHMAINHGAHALFLLLLAPTLRAHGGRAILVSSYASIVANLRRDDIHLRKMQANWFTAYANSKLAQILFARAVMMRESKLPVLCVHPGESTTDVARYLGVVLMWLHQNVGRLFLLSPRTAARTSVYAAAWEIFDDDTRFKGGELLHAIRRTIVLPHRLLNNDDADWMWEETLKMIDMTEQSALSALGACYNSSSA